MKFEHGLKEAVFVARKTRFSAVVEIEGREVIAYLPNSGRMRELLLPGAIVLVTEVTWAPGRITALDLVMVRHGDLLVSIDSRMPNRLVNEALLDNRLMGFEGCNVISREPAYGDSRLDFLLGTPNGHYCLLETKSVTLVQDQVAMFPDAPTLRGVRHLNDLTRSQAEDFAAAMVFIVQRNDAVAFRPNTGMDPLFGKTIQIASKAGIMLKAFRCNVSEEEILLEMEIPVHL